MGDIDVLIIGAGPAGCIAAFNLAPFYRVMVVDDRPRPGVRIGESLVPAARRLLADMGLLEGFLAQNHAPHFGNRASWGQDQMVETDFVRDIDGPGWHLDRALFEGFLRDAASRRGVNIQIPYSLESIDPAKGDIGFDVVLNPSERPQSDDVQHVAGDNRAAHLSGGQRNAAPPLNQNIRARFVIDASGRNAVVARKLNAQRQQLDRLVCGWLHGQTNGETRDTAGFSTIVAVRDGWWYSSPLPGSRRVLSFHTDGHLPAARYARDPALLLQRAADVPHINELMSMTRFKALPASGYTAAHSSVLSHMAGSGWRAIGDAAMCFDPLSSRGLFNALYTGLLVAENVWQALQTGQDTSKPFQTAMNRISTRYQQHLRYWYGGETRWPDQPFWAARQPEKADENADLAV